MTAPAESWPNMPQCVSGAEAFLVSLIAAGSCGNRFLLSDLQEMAE